MNLSKLKGHVPDSVIDKIPDIQEKFGITNLLQITSENGQGVVSLLQELIG